MAELCIHIQETLAKIPLAKEQILCLQEYEEPSSKEDSQTLLIVVRNKYQDIMRVLNLELTVDKCHNLIASSGKEHSPVILNVNKPIAKEYMDYISHALPKLIQAREELKHMWQKAEHTLLLLAKVYNYTGKAQRVLNWLREVGIPKAAENPEAAECQSRAEILKNHFETGFLNISKNVIWLAEKILDKAKVLQPNLDDVHSGKLQVICDALTTDLKTFRQQVKKKHQFYINMHSFFCCSHKVSLWYDGTMRFLPLEFLDKTLDRNGCVAYRATVEWTLSIRQHQICFPAPTIQLLQQLELMLPVIDDTGVREKVCQLISRVNLLKKLLHDPGEINESEMMQVLNWKDIDIMQIPTLCSSRCTSVDLANKQVELASVSETKRGTKSSLGVSIANNSPLTVQKGGNLERYKSERLSAYKGKVGSTKRDGLLHSSMTAIDLPQKYEASAYRSLATIRKPQKLKQRNAYSGGGGQTGSLGIYGTADSPLSHKETDSSNERYVSLDYREYDQLVPESLSYLDIHALENNLPQKYRTNTIHFSSGTNPQQTNTSETELFYQPTDLQTAVSLPDLSSFGDQSLQITKSTIDSIVNSTLPAEEKLNLMAYICESGDTASQAMPPEAIVHANGRKANNSSMENLYEGESRSFSSESNSQLNSDCYLQGNRCALNYFTTTDNIRQHAHAPQLAISNPPKLDFPYSGCKIENEQTKSIVRPSHSFSGHMKHSTINTCITAQTSKQLGYVTFSSDNTEGKVSDAEISGIALRHANQQSTDKFPVLPAELDDAYLDAEVEIYNSLSQMQDETRLKGIYEHTDTCQAVAVHNMHNQNKDKCGIDIHNWIQQTQGSSKQLPPPRLESPQIGDSLIEYMMKLKEAHKERISAEIELENEQIRLGEVKLEEISQEQEAVAHSLQQTAHVLQEEEGMLAPGLVAENSESSTGSNESGVYTLTGSDPNPKSSALVSSRHADLAMLVEKERHYAAGELNKSTVMQSDDVPQQPPSAFPKTDALSNRDNSLGYRLLDKGEGNTRVDCQGQHAQCQHISLSVRNLHGNKKINTEIVRCDRCLPDMDKEESVLSAVPGTIMDTNNESVTANASSSNGYACDEMLGGGEYRESRHLLVTSSQVGTFVFFQH